MRKRWIAGGVAVALFLTGIGVMELTGSGEEQETEEKDQRSEVQDAAARITTTEGYISASGTTQAGADYQYLSLSLPGGRVGLVVEEVYVEAGTTVEEGQALLKLTEESLSQVEARLQSQVDAAQTALSEAQLSYEAGLLEAQSERTANRNLKSSATAQLNQTKTSLANAVKKASETLEEAGTIIAEYPQKITDSKAELKALEKAWDELQEGMEAAQESWKTLTLANQQIKQEYAAKKEAYETLQATLDYAKKYAESTGLTASDTDIEAGAESVQETGPETDAKSDPETGSEADAKSDPEMGLETDAKSDPKTDSQEQSGNTLKNDAGEAFQAYIAVLEQETESARQTYEQIRAQYDAAVEEEKALEKEIAEQTQESGDYQSQIQECEQEIARMENALEQAKSNLVQYQINYDEAVVKQRVNGVSAQNTYDQTMVTYNHTDDIYALAVAKLDEALQAAEDSYAQAEENLRLFQETFADGILYSEQAGYISSFTYSAGDMIQAGSIVVAYYNGSKLTVTVSVDQADIAAIQVGDSVNVQISSASRVQEGKVTAVDAQTDSESISNVTYTVEITIDNADGRLSSGETAQIIFESSRSEEDDNE